MRLLLDCHALLWYIGADPKLSSLAEELVNDGENEVFVSVATLWELSIKHGLGNPAGARLQGGSASQDR